MDITVRSRHVAVICKVPHLRPVPETANEENDQSKREINPCSATFADVLVLLAEETSRPAFRFSFDCRDAVDKQKLAPHIAEDPSEVLPALRVRLLQRLLPLI